MEREHLLAIKVLRKFHETDPLSGWGEGLQNTYFLRMLFFNYKSIFPILPSHRRQFREENFQQRLSHLGAQPVSIKIFVLIFVSLHRVTRTYTDVAWWVVLIRRLKIHVFPILLPFPLYQGNTLALTNVVNSLVNFITAYKRMWHLCVVAGMSDSKSPKLYYFFAICFFNKIYSTLLSCLLLSGQMNLSDFPFSIVKIWIPDITIQRITRPRLAIQQKLAASENICDWNYEKRPRVIRLNFEYLYFGRLWRLLVSRAESSQTIHVFNY